MSSRLTVSTLACPNWSLSRIVEQAAQFGLDGIDFRGVGNVVDHSLLPAFGSESAHTRALLESKRLSVPCMCSSVRLMIVDEHEWQTALDEFRRYLRLADAFGSPFIRIFPGATPNDLPRDEAAAMARRHARELVEVAAGHRAIPLLETHDDWGASSEVIKLLADCPAEQFGVIWDVRHTWAAGESPVRVIDTLGSRLRHVHVKDSILVDGKEQPSLLGEGIVTVGPALRALAKSDYDGWICLETEKRWYPATAPEPEASIPQFVRFVRAID